MSVFLIENYAIVKIFVCRPRVNILYTNQHQPMLYAIDLCPLNCCTQITVLDMIIYYGTALYACTSKTLSKQSVYMNTQVFIFACICMQHVYMWCVHTNICTGISLFIQVCCSWYMLYCNTQRTWSGVRFICWKNWIFTGGYVLWCVIEVRVCL